MIARTTSIAVLFVGLALVTLAGSQLLAALAAAPGDPVVAALNDDRPVSPAALERLAETRRSALAWYRSPGHYRDHGRAAWLVARGLDDDRRQAEAAYLEATASTEDGLRLAPVDPVAWLRLAAIRLEFQEDPRAALTALRAAVRSGPYDPFRTEVRVAMILRLWPHLDGSDRVLFRSQFDHLWNDDPDALTRLARDERAFLIALAMLGEPDNAQGLRQARDSEVQTLP